MRNGLSRWFVILLLAMLVPACSRSSGKTRVAFVSNNEHGFWTYAERGCEQAAKETGVELEVGKYTLGGTRTDDSSESKCQNKAEEILRLDPDIVCMIGLWEYNPPALLRAVRGSKSKPAIVAFDENFQTLEGIQSGEI